MGGLREYKTEGFSLDQHRKFQIFPNSKVFCFMPKICIWSAHQYHTSTEMCGSDNFVFKSRYIKYVKCWNQLVLYTELCAHSHSTHNSLNGSSGLQEQCFQRLCQRLVEVEGNQHWSTVMKIKVLLVNLIISRLQTTAIFIHWYHRVSWVSWPEKAASEINTREIKMHL